MELKTILKQPIKNRPLLDYLEQRFTYRPREDWGRMIEEGNILVNGERCTAETLINRGDELTTILEDPDLPDVNFDYDIVYEDEWLLAVNKPAGLRVHGKGRYIHANLIHHLRYERPDPYPTADLIHRIDANTSGIVLLAKDKEVLKTMQLRFRQRQIKKTYLAWVHGHITQPRRVINVPIGRVPSLEGVYRYGAMLGETGKPSATLAESIFHVQSPAGDTTFMKLIPHTGRTHQLRVHMAYIGHPLVGDQLYLLDDESYLRWWKEPEGFPTPLWPHHALHAAELAFTHPINGEWTRIPTPNPAWLNVREA